MANVWRCAYNTDHSSGVRVVNTFHVVARRDFGSIADASAASVRDALHAALTTKYKALFITDYTLQSLVVREELAPGDTSVPDEASQTIGSVGTLGGSGDKFPVPVCLLVTLYTNAAIRSGHGRLFLPNPGYASALDASGLWDTGGVWWPTTTTAFLDELKTVHSADDGASGTNSLSLVVYSRTRRARAAAEYYFDVQSYTKRRQPHWLRSRMTAP